MIFRKQDIITRRERSGRKVIWISEDMLVGNYEINEEYLRKKARLEYRNSVSNKKQQKDILPDTGKSWRYAKFHRAFYYDYDRIPTCGLPPKSELLQLYQNALANNRQSNLEQRLSAALTEGYKNYLHHYAGYSDVHANQLSRACAVLCEAAKWIQLNSIDVRKNTFFRDLSIVVSRLEAPYLPKNYRRLKEKVVIVYEGQPVEEIIDLPRAGNKNALRHTDKEILSWLIQLRRMPQNYTGAYIIRKVQAMCQLTDKNAPSTRWFESKLAEYKVKFLTGKGRFGSGKYGAAYEGYMPVQNALFAGDCWQVDGTRVNLIGHRGPDGKEQFLYIIAVIDVHSGDVLGWHFDTKEDRWGYAHALKMAVTMAGYLPWELVVDRFPGHNTQEWGIIQKRMEKLGTKVTITSKKTGKAKAERFFGTLQTVFLQDSPYYYGEGVQSKREYAHRSPEYLKQIRKKAKSENWDFDAAWRETVRCLEAYKSTPYSEYSRRYRTVTQSPQEIHAASEKPNVANIDPWEFVELFGFEKRVTIRNNGLIRTEIQRMSYAYQIENYQIIANYRKVALCYDMEDLGKVYLFEASDEINRTYLGEAIEARAVQMYGPSADKSTVGKSAKRIKQIEEKRQAELEQWVNEGDELELLLAGLNDKPAVASAESRWLIERSGEWTDQDKPRILSANVEIEEEPEEDITFYARSMY